MEKSHIKYLQITFSKKKKKLQITNSLMEGIYRRLTLKWREVPSLAIK